MFIDCHVKQELWYIEPCNKNHHWIYGTRHSCKDRIKIYKRRILIKIKSKFHDILPSIKYFSFVFIQFLWTYKHYCHGILILPLSVRKKQKCLFSMFKVLLSIKKMLCCTPKQLFMTGRWSILKLVACVYTVHTNVWM